MRIQYFKVQRSIVLSQEVGLRARTLICASDGTQCYKARNFPIWTGGLEDLIEPTLGLASVLMSFCCLKLSFQPKVYRGRAQGTSQDVFRLFAKFKQRIAKRALRRQTCIERAG